MKIIEPQVELWQQTDPISHVTRCARVCYGNAVSKGEEADKRLYESLKKSGHLSMFRHESVYAIVAASEGNIRILNHYVHNPFIQVRLDNLTSSIYIATNDNFMINNRNEWIGDFIKENKVTPEHFANTEIGHSMMRYTFHITTQISTSRELNRVSPNSISEQSTRYVDESNGAICRPHWLSKEIADWWNNTDDEKDDPEDSTERKYATAYLNGCIYAFNTYNLMLGMGMKRENVRGVLPLDTATEVVYTYSIPEWKHIIELRSDKRAHPNCRIIANMIKEQLEQLGYNF